MADKTVRFKVAIQTSRSGGDIPAFLDMLRYEGGEVVAWDRIDGDMPTFDVTIRVERTRHVPDRWASFGIYTKEVL